jgi:hypothetical protein
MLYNATTWIRVTQLIRSLKSGNTLYKFLIYFYIYYFILIFWISTCKDT